MTGPEHNVVFRVLDEKYCIAKLPPDAPLPGNGAGKQFFSATRTADELSIVCLETEAPTGAAIERSWRCIKVKGPLEFSLKGVLVSLLLPLAEANIAVFAISTYETDYLLVKQQDVNNAVKALELAGHRISV